MSVENVFRNLDLSSVRSYSDYWQSIAPQSREQVFQRWLFAFTSIHTNWLSNVRGYEAIRNFEEWIEGRELLLKKLTDARVGMQNMRTKFIWGFAEDFWQNPQDFEQAKGENWEQWRTRMTKRVPGIGLAKVSFTLEMVAPLACEVVCLNTHMLQLFGQSFNTGSTSGNAYQQYLTSEQTWVDFAVQHQIPAYIARCMFWDAKQGKKDSRYWSYVLEQ